MRCSIHVIHENLKKWIISLDFDLGCVWNLIKWIETILKLTLLIQNQPNSKHIFSSNFDFKTPGDVKVLNCIATLLTN